MTTDYTKLSDEQLMQKCSEDNMRAFNQLFERYFGLLFNFSVKYVEETVAEELAMDLMHNIWKKRTSLEIKGNVDRYLFSAMKNVIFNHIRKNELATVSIDTLSEVPALASPAPDHNLEYKELERIYHLKLNQLSPQRKKIFKLSREENMTYPQIAKDMNLSINTIKTQMLVSLKFLRENMNEHIDVTLALFLFLFF